jgi:heptaprenyl diphosphate synthase
MAFQITDDILDLVAEQKQLGKPVGSDLRQGIITLPVIYALKHSPERERLRTLILSSNKSEELIQEAITIIQHCGGIQYSIEVAEKYIWKAKGALKNLPQRPAKKILEKVADFVSIRKF